jgi:hypothetical protein
MSTEKQSFVFRSDLTAILAGGLVVGVLDAIDALIAFKVFAGFDPIPIYQFVASGILGKSAFSGGYTTAAIGLFIHFLISFSASAAYVVASKRLTVLREQWIFPSLIYGVGIYFLMNYAVIPLSQIAPAPFSLPLFINGVVGHAILVGLPLGYIATRTRRG